MKTINRSYLPEFIKYNGKKYIYGEQTDKSIKVLVLSTALRKKTNICGNYYKPTVHYFNPE